MPIYKGVNGVNRTVNRIYRTVDGVNRVSNKKFIGHNGANRTIFGTPTFTYLYGGGYNIMEAYTGSIEIIDNIQYRNSEAVHSSQGYWVIHALKAANSERGFSGMRTYNLQSLTGVQSVRAVVEVREGFDIASDSHFELHAFSATGALSVNTLIRRQSANGLGVGSHFTIDASVAHLSGSFYLSASIRRNGTIGTTTLRILEFILIS